VTRYTEFRLDASTVQTLSDGTLKVVGQLTRPGIFSYRNPDGSERKEYRPAEEVFKKSALDTFAGLSLTVNHPPTRLVSPDTWKNVAIGHVGDHVREDAGHVVADLYIKDAGAIARINKGELRHISCGYKVDFDATPGTTPDGVRHDGVQRNMRGNHVALLAGEMPRGGQECVLRLDSAGDEITGSNSFALNSHVELEALKAKVTVLESELAKARTDAAEVTALTAKLAQAEKDLAVAIAQNSPERLDALVEERTAIIATAKGAGVETAGKSTLAIKRAIVAKKTPELATRVDAFGAEAVDAILAVYSTQPHPTMAAAVSVVAADVARADATVDPNAIPKQADLYAASVKASHNAWKNSGDSTKVGA
jgi:hypothetical protein